jgi:hypothetical protein
MLRWTVVTPALALLTLIATWGSEPATLVLVVVGAFLAGSVLAAVQEGGVHLVLFGAFAFLAVNP